MKLNNKTLGYISIMALLSVTSLFSINLFFQQRSSRDIVDIRNFPYAIGDWKGKDLKVAEYEYKILETKNLILREYTNSINDRLILFIIYSETNRSVFHPPEICLIGSGFKIVDEKVEKIDCCRHTFFTNKIYTEKNNRKELVLNSYKSGNFYTDNYYIQQMHFAINQLFRKRIRGATIRVSMPIGRDEEATLASLKKFMETSAKIIDSL